MWRCGLVFVASGSSGSALLCFTACSMDPTDTEGEPAMVPDRGVEGEPAYLQQTQISQHKQNMFEGGVGYLCFLFCVAPAQLDC